MSLVTDVYALLRQRELSSSLTALNAARAALPLVKDNVERLALLQAVVECADALLSEAGEHGADNEADHGVDLAALDLGALVDEHRAALLAARALEDAGVRAAPLTQRFVAGTMFPVGSRSWTQKQRNAERHRDSAWVARIVLRLASTAPQGADEADEEDD
jgi:hypothetical protein